MQEEVESGSVRPRRALLCIAISLLLFLVPTNASFSADIRLTTAVGLAMALLWLTEALPLGLTALLPLIVFPLAGVQTAEKVAAPYANPAVFLFLGGFLVARTVERWGLHRRIAWLGLSIIGTQPRRIVLAVLVTTSFLSMWMSNTATTLMMTPIALALLASLRARADESGAQARTAEAILLAVAYGASLGGVATPIGTPTNLIFFGASKQLFPALPLPSFAQWSAIGMFYLLLAVPLCWLILLFTCGVKDGAAVPIESLGLERPGKFSVGERNTLLLCITTALLWIFRADIELGSFVIPGWSNLFPEPKRVHDATVAVTMALVAFLLPGGGEKRLLEWEDFKKVPWDVLILFGGGFALAETLESTGFSKFAGKNLSFVGGWSPVAMIVALCLAVTILSEVASNVATATAMMPVTAALATSLGIHPFALMLPAVIAASSGFMLPIATAPNTIVFGTGHVRVKAMARAGLLLDLAATVIITIALFVVAPRVLGIALFR